MNKLTICGLALSGFGLAACGGGGGGATVGAPAFNDNVAFANAANGGDLSGAETNTQGTLDPTDDVVSAVGGFAAGSDGSLSTDITSQTNTTTAGPQTTVTLNGQTSVLSGTSNVSDDGRFVFLNGSTLTDDASTVTIVGTGDNLDGAGTPSTVFGYVRGLATTTSDLPTGAGVNYSGDTRLAREGSSSVEDGSFDVTANFSGNTVTGNVNTSSLNGTVNGDLQDGAISGTITPSAGDDWTLRGNIYGSDGDEIAGAANGSVGGDDAVLVFNGTRN